MLCTFQSICIKGVEFSYYEKVGKVIKNIDNEIPFTIPDSWKWCRLKTICKKIVDGSHNPPKGLDFVTPYIMASSRNIIENTISDLSNVRYLNKENFIKEHSRTNVKINDILLTTVATLGRSCIYKGKPENLCFQRSVTVITSCILPTYLKLFFDAPYFQNIIVKSATGTAQKGFYLNQLENVLICIPPLAEQDKISCGIAHIDKLRSYLDAPEEIHLGRKPENLLETLVNMVLGSPAICIYRSNGRSTARATSLAKVFVNNFNLSESTAIIDLAYGRCRDDNSHWQNVLKYCKDGCFQAMIDEYIHMLKETAGFQSDGNQYQIVHDMMMDSLKIHTATYIADTYPDFKKRINGADRKSDGCRIRSSYAVGFTKDAGDNSKVVMRKENIRNAFNSPMRPFVLATTSIGQEGLDFHNYCRVIMHWNLPSNPIDLEQREGRINRFKCLAIRQNVADKYGKADGITFKRDIWTEMFEAAKAEKQNDQSELVPFWCFGKNQSVKIERLVPMYPMSKDEVNYERLIKILSLYRLTLGQARQEELLEYLFKEFKDTSGLKKLFIDLSPFSKGKEG